ncbi:leucine-rich repeat extensin-like protein 5 isoform X3 [Populus trichocarpa]|uniref:leucine-rich repeat extensin-like protein 5 isoform X3 n=1 Tax=Populus trichocarpa TaxID=3694 RepID=UPI00227757C0|nr:leucine-rich repeat extensin-like protein 5 isoform X3 [Populus trichocarpa]
MPNSGSRPSPGFPMASLPGTTLWSTGKPPSGSQPSLLPPNVAAGRPTGPPVSQPPPPLASRPSPPGSMPSSMRGPAVPPSGGFPSPGSPSGPTVPPPPGVRPSPFASSSPLSSGPVVNTSSVPPNEAVSNGMSFASGSMLGGPRFPPVSSTRPPPMGSPPIVSAPAPPQAPPVSSMQSRPPFSVGGPGVPPPFLAGSQGVPPPPGPPFGAQTWSLQPQQPPTKFGTPPHLANQGFAEETPVTISATWVQMVGAGMLMKGLNCVEERWNLLLQRSTWFITITPSQLYLTLPSFTMI